MASILDKLKRSSAWAEVEINLNWKMSDDNLKATSKGHNTFYSIINESMEDRSQEWGISIKNPTNPEGYYLPMTFADLDSAKWFCEFDNLICIKDANAG